MLDTNIPANEVSRTYFSKDTTKNFKKFLQNPEENVRKIRAVRSENVADTSTVSEGELFASLWESLTTEEKQMLYTNPDKVVVQCDSHLTVSEDSLVARYVRSKSADLLGEMVVVYGFNARLNDLFNGKTLPLSLLPEKFLDNSIKDVPAVPVFDKYIKEGNWDVVDSCLEYLDYPISLADLQKESEKLLVGMNEQNIVRASGVIDSNDKDPLRVDLGKTLVDGAVLLESFKDKAFYVAGKYSHGGIFSKELFDKGDGSDGTRCVYTAQPKKKKYKGTAEYIMPDRPGYACLDTIFMYTKFQRYAVILPKGYTDSNAKKAVNTAKTVFYDPKPEYKLPLWEVFFPWYDTSHDMTNKNTYCTKVVYTAWKSAGKDLDSNVFAGNLVSPDDIYGSTINRYKTIKVKSSKWSKTYTLQVYKATADLIDARER